MLFQRTFNLELTGILGAIAGFIGAVVLLYTAVKAMVYLWKTIIVPSKERLAERRTQKRELALANFERRWLFDHNDKPIFILDEDQKCIFVNEALCRTLHVDSEDLKGRKWHRIIRESRLSNTLLKWDEAYKHQSPYVNVSELMVGRKVVRFTVTADPFVFNNKVREYIGTLEPFDFIEESVPPNLLTE